MCGGEGGEECVVEGGEADEGVGGVEAEGEEGGAEVVPVDR